MLGQTRLKLPHGSYHEQKSVPCDGFPSVATRGPGWWALLGSNHLSPPSQEGRVSGTGSAQPTGIVTALTGTGSEIQSNTTDVFNIADVYDVHETLPARYRRNAKWIANWLIYQAIREAGGANLDDFWANLNKGKPALLLGEPALISSEIDGVINAGSDNYVMVYGDWSNYVIARRLGFTVELIPHLFATANNRPSGQRGLSGYVRQLTA